MTAVLAWVITVLVVAVLVAFIVATVSLRSLPTRERPRTATYDRFGGLIGMMENPDYHENMGELLQDEGEGSP